MATAPPTDAEGVLERFLTEVVADDYPPASDEPRSAAPRRRRVLSALALGLIGVLVVVAVVSTRASDASRQSTREALVARVSALSDAVTARQAQVDAQNVEVGTLRDEVLAAGDAQDLTEATERLAVAGALTPVAGPGVTVTVDDSPEAASDALNRVLDRDLQDIVNALWRGGATAVAVNDQRLTTTTAIRGAGEAILVNFQPLTRPYRVSAVAPAGGRIDVTGAQGLLGGLSDDYGLITDLTEGDVALPAGAVRPLRYAIPTEGTAGQ